MIQIYLLTLTDKSILWPVEVNNESEPSIGEMDGLDDHYTFVVTCLLQGPRVSK